MPLSADAAAIVHPGIDLRYEGEADGIGLATRITYVPAGILERVPPIVREVVPDDITLVVAEFEDGSRSRLDVLESTKGAGSIRRSVEAGENGLGLLVVEADLSIDVLSSPMKAMFKRMFGSTPEEVLIRYGVDLPSQATLDHLPAIIA